MDCFFPGILSLFCAQAGAAKVYAIEGAQQLAKLTREVVAKNGFSHLIEVYAHFLITLLLYIR